ncbi:MAG: branched-chain amino acid ABC transporter permease [Chloroflexota bacterium]
MPGSGNFKTGYAADSAIFDTPSKKLWAWAFIALLLVLPLVLPKYYVHLLNVVLLASIGTLMLNFLIGYTGMISFGQAAFLASGAFTTAILTHYLHAPFWLCLIAAGLVGALLGTLAGLPAIRLRGAYLVLSTIAIHYIVTVNASLYQAKVGYTAGIAIPEPVLFGFILNTSFRWYYLLLIAVLAVTIVSINIERSAVGRIWKAIGSRDIAAMALGVNVAYYKVLAFAFTSAVTAMAGALSAFYMSYVSVDEYTLWLSVTYLAMVIVGGAGSILGSFLGALFITMLPYVISELADLTLPTQLGYYRFALQWALFGVIILVFLIMEPEGLTGIWRRVKTYFEQWPLRYFKTPNTVR